MGNQNGKVYGLTLLCPILADERAVPSHDLQIRNSLAKLAQEFPGPRSPFTRSPATHLARLVVMDDVVYVGAPACEEHLNSKYLIFETNCDCHLEAYMTELATTIPDLLNNIWKHCTNYPGTKDLSAFLHYMKTCQIETTFFFAATNDKTRDQTLTALQTQRAVADFLTAHQGMDRIDPARLQREFLDFAGRVKAAPVPPAAIFPERRTLQTGGHNE